jgi:hypothetical protein
MNDVVSIVNCSHARDCGITHGVCCAIGAYERPSFGTCKRCAKRDKVAEDAPDKGLGDKVAAITTALRIPTCGGCQRRATWLNRVGRFLSRR